MADAVRITLSDPDFAALPAQWRALEADSDGSFFQSWSWVGCQAAARFARPLLLRAERDGRTVALALANRTRAWHGAETLWLGESGDPAWDSIYVEQNGPLLARGAEALRPALLRALLGPAWRGRRLRLAGVDAAHLAAARQAGAVRLRARDPAPWLDLVALAAGADGFLASLSANTRAQLRRSDRAYAAAGPIRVERAATLAEAWQVLDALAALHQARWTARGRPGAFATPAFAAFHRELIGRALPRGEVDLLRIAAGAAVIGYLYNFRHRGRVLAYQSGFDYAAAGARQKPGLTCHHAAIQAARRDGAVAYDFLAGGDRYKTSLANATRDSYWLDMARRWSAEGLGYRLAGLVDQPI
jgi:CelD/BcsL family acetyltransferase involved in cellulose biosynthesis